MKGRKAELSSNLVAVKGAAAPAADMPSRAGPPTPVRSAPEPEKAGQGREEIVPLNFRVPASFRREFKSYAASHDLKLSQLLPLSFAAYRKAQGN